MLLQARGADGRAWAGRYWVKRPLWHDMPGTQVALPPISVCNCFPAHPVSRREAARFGLSR
jgi:hypothetical protein